MTADQVEQEYLARCKRVHTATTALADLLNEVLDPGSELDQAAVKLGELHFWASMGLANWKDDRLVRLTAD